MVVEVHMNYRMYTNHQIAAPTENWLLANATRYSRFCYFLNAESFRLIQFFHYMPLNNMCIRHFFCSLLVFVHVRCLFVCVFVVWFVVCVCVFSICFCWMSFLLVSFFLVSIPFLNLLTISK